PLSPHQREAVYAASASLGTTLQVSPEQWPASRAAFEQYWQRGLGQVSIAPPVRDMLLSIVDLRFLPAAVRVPCARLNRFLTTGFLPSTFRAQLGLLWTQRDQHRFDRLCRGIGVVVLRLPGPVRRFPLNLFLIDLRHRL